MQTVQRPPDLQLALFDAIRLFATFAVFVQHATGNPALADDKIELLGRAVIPVFLIISGYMTAMTIKKNAGFLKQCARRYLKYYYIVVPAIFITYFSDLYLIWVKSPLRLDSAFETDHGLYVFMRESFQALTFSGEYWRMNTFSQGMFGNAAFWTMDYILAYVVATLALALLSGRARVFALILIFLIAGPTVLLLAPLWFAGVYANALHQSPKKWMSFLEVKSIAIVVLLVGIGISVVVEVLHYGSDLYEASKSVIPHKIRVHFGMAKRFSWQWLHGFSLFLVLLSAKYALPRNEIPKMQKWLRTAALYTLPIYILHFTNIFIARSFIPNYRVGWQYPDVYVMMVLAMCLTLIMSWATIRLCKPVGDRMVKSIFG